MIALLLALAPMITADGVNIGNLYDRCTGRAALAILQSTRTAEQVADAAMGKCRHLEPKLKEGLDLSWRRDRSGKVSSPPSWVSQMLTEESWNDLLASRRRRLVEDIHKARRHFGYGRNAED